MRSVQPSAQAEFVFVISHSDDNGVRRIARRHVAEKLRILIFRSRYGKIAGHNQRVAAGKMLGVKIKRGKKFRARLSVPRIIAVYVVMYVRNDLKVQQRRLYRFGRRRACVQKRPLFQRRGS